MYTRLLFVSHTCFDGAHVRGLWLQEHTGPARTGCEPLDPGPATGMIETAGDHQPTGFSRKSRKCTRCTAEDLKSAAEHTAIVPSDA